MDSTVKIKIESEDMDTAIEKASRLVELLQEAQRIVGSLSGKEELKS